MKITYSSICRKIISGAPPTSENHKCNASVVPLQLCLQIFTKSN